MDKTGFFSIAIKYIIVLLFFFFYPDKFESIILIYVHIKLSFSDTD